MCRVCTHNGDQSEFDEDEYKHAHNKKAGDHGDNDDPQQVAIITVCPG